MSRGPLVLTVHGLDARGEDGLVADAAVLAELGCRVACAATCVACGTSVEPLAAPLVVRQLDAAFDQGPPRAARVGVLLEAGQVEAVAGRLRERRPDVLVVAPVTSWAGFPLRDREALEATLALLLPLGTVVIVRGADLHAITGDTPDDIEGIVRAAAGLREKGTPAVLVVGVPARGRILDVLDEGGRIAVFDATRLRAPHIPGLAGAHAAALTGHLALGLSLPVAVEAAQRYVRFRLQRGR